LLQQKTIVHVTDVFADRSGVIGKVIDGLVTSGSYGRAVARSILIGPVFETETGVGKSISVRKRYGQRDQILYSFAGGITDHPYAVDFAAVERKFGVDITYGYRDINASETGTNAKVEFVLIDTARCRSHPVNALKAWLFEEFGIQSDRYEDNVQYNEYVKMAPAALAVLRAMGVSSPANPAILISHDYMGLPTVLAAVLDPLVAFKTIYYAHEVPMVRRIVERHPGHDTMFDNTMRWARRNNYYLPEIFGPQEAYFKHPLITAACFCDNIIAASDRVKEELRFLGPHFGAGITNIDVTYGGLAAREVTLEQKQNCKAQLGQYTNNILGFTPDYVFTHLDEITVSGGFWRDLRVLFHLDHQFQCDSRTAVFLMRKADAKLDAAVVDFNARSSNIKAIYVKPVGKDKFCYPGREPCDITISDLAIAGDLEFGQSIYEPFGFSQLEALSLGSLCVAGSMCGCLGLIDGVMPDGRFHNIITADYTQLGAELDRELILSIDQAGRDRIENHVSLEVAKTISKRLAQNDGESEKLLRYGRGLTDELSWDNVCESYFIPAINYAYRIRRHRYTA